MLKEYVGKYVTLQVVKQAPQGLYLGLDLESKDTILLPKAYTKGENIGDKIEVFIYTDSEDRLVATSLKPLAKLDDVVLLKIKDSNEHGLFLDIGLPKDVFMPLKSKLKNVKENKELIKTIASGGNVDKKELESHERYKVGDKISAIISRDKQHRMMAKNDIARFVKKCEDSSIVHKRAKAIIFSESKLGFSCVILPQRYSGLIYHNEFTNHLKIDTEIYVKITKLRDDGNLDLKLERDKAGLLKMISKNSASGGCFIPNEKNANALNMSKSGLEKELAALLKSKKIESKKLENNEIGYVISKNQGSKKPFNKGFNKNNKNLTKSSKAK